MPYLQVDLEAIKRAFQAAPVAGLTGQQVLGGLNCLWAWAWQEKQDLVTRLQLESIFGGGSPRLAEALAAFGFLDVADGDQFRVKGSDRYLRLAEARARGARATNAKLGRTSVAQATQVRRTSDALTPIHRSTESPNIDSRLLSADADVPPRVQRVFNHWRTTLGHPAAKLDRKRRQAISSALALGYTEEQLTIAIAGCASSPWHLGKNDRKTRYDALTLILRDAEQIDKFIGLRMTTEQQQQEFGRGG